MYETAREFQEINSKTACAKLIILFKYSTRTMSGKNTSDYNFVVALFKIISAFLIAQYVQLIISNNPKYIYTYIHIYALENVTLSKRVLGIQRRPLFIA